MAEGDSQANAPEQAAWMADAITSVDTAPLIPPSPRVAPQTAPRREAWKGEGARPLRSKRHVFNIVALIVLWVVLFGVIAEGVSTGLQLYHSFSQARIDAADAVRHLNAVRALIPASASGGKLSGLAPVLTDANLAAARSNLTIALEDFQSLKVDLEPTGAMGVVTHAPIAGDPLQAATLLADAGEQGCRAGLLLIGDAQNLLAYLKGGIFVNGKPSALTPGVVARLRADLITATAQIDQAVRDINAANLSSIPSSLLKPSYVTLLRGIAAKWPAERAQLTALQPWLDVAPTLLGLGSPASYLVEIMDNNELRAGGGFIGNFTLITLTNGQVKPFTLEDSYLLDRPYQARVGVSPAPAQYAWWPWASYFGLRDSNLSPDFPTNARLAMRLYSLEGGPTVRGVIAITPTTIQRVLQVVGSIPMPLYHVTVTSANLISLIEHYQLAVNPQTDLPPADQISSPNKRFVALLGRALLQKLHSMTLPQMMDIAQTFGADMQQKDVQLYFTDTRSQALLTKLGYDGATSHGPGDAVTINDTNDGVNKANQFTTATYKDVVTLDAQGNATHNLTITYRFRATNLALLYGPDRYQTYLRIYAPSAARLKSISGLKNILGHDQVNHSDLSWRQMWGGYVLVANGVPYTLHLVWVVPHAATCASDGHCAYTLVYQRQPGAQQALDLTISAPGQKKPAAAFSGPLVTDKLFSVDFG
ncbi:MAG TPA: DUF4012 domain-containing protein [Ktedonobacterales bacterium]